MLHEFLVWLGFRPSKQDLRISDMVSKSYNSVEVYGRGGIRLDPNEVIATDEWKIAQQQAKDIVRD